LDCELAVDRSGRSLGEAEVQFANRESAIKAVQQLDGELADGNGYWVINEAVNIL
jgi:RNA recognition motif-containing protein